MNTDLIIENTKIMGSLLNEKMTPLNKFDLVVSLRKNLTELREILTKEEFKQFIELDNRVNKIIDKFTSDSFMSKITSTLSSLFIK